MLAYSTGVMLFNELWGLVRADFEIALELANKLDSIFEKGNNDNRRLLCETVFKQVRVREGKIVEMLLNSPFELIVSQAKGSESLLAGQQMRAFPDSSTVERAAVNR